MSTAGNLIVLSAKIVLPRRMTFRGQWWQTEWSRLNERDRNSHPRRDLRFHLERAHVTPGLPLACAGQPSNTRYELGVLRGRKCRTSSASAICKQNC